MEWIMVSFGGGIGATLRYLIQLWIIKIKISSYWATATVNVFGSIFLGIASHNVIESSTILVLLTVGILGAFTTFSTFAFDIVKLVEAKKWRTAFLFTSINLIGGILGFLIGWTF